MKQKWQKLYLSLWLMLSVALPTPAIIAAEEVTSGLTSTEVATTTSNEAVEANTEETTSLTAEPYLTTVTVPEIESKTSLTLEAYMRSDATTLASMVRKGEVTSQELIKLAAQAIAQTNPEYNNVITLRIEAALKEAAALEDKGQPFYGVPILVKGLGHTVVGGQNSNGIGFLEDQVSKSNGRVTKAFQEAGFIVIGQTSFPQYGWINVTNSDLYGVTHNPWDVTLNPGGSSGGSAVAVVIGQVPVATSSDGGGSTRIPASWSGLIGLHPTRGIMVYDTKGEKQQVTNFAETRTMTDTQALFEALVKDPSSLTNGQLDKSQPIAYTLKTPAGTPISEDAIKAVKAAVAFLEEQGYQLEEVDYPTDGKALMEQYYKIAAASAGSVDYLATSKLKRHVTADDVELLTWALYQTSKDLTKEDVAEAWNYVADVTKKMEAFYQKYPIFLTATNAYTAPAANYNHISAEMAERMKDMSDLTKEEKLDLIYQQWLPAWTLTPYTQLANLTGMPAISLPTYVSDKGAPLGVMLSSYATNDRALLNLGALFEQKDKFQTFYHRQNESTTVAPEETTEAMTSESTTVVPEETTEATTSETTTVAPEVTTEATTSETTTVAPEVTTEVTTSETTTVVPEVTTEATTSETTTVAPEITTEATTSQSTTIAPEITTNTEMVTQGVGVEPNGTTQTTIGQGQSPAKPHTPLNRFARVISHIFAISGSILTLIGLGIKWLLHLFI